MSTSPVTQKESGLGHTIWNYASEPLAAGLAIMPAFKGLMVKTALQEGKEAPKITFFEGLKAGRKAASTAGAVIGVQMIAQNILEQQIGKDPEEQSIKTKFASALIVGVVSSPMLATLNKQTSEPSLSMIEALGSFSKGQAFAISMREIPFIASLSCMKLLEKEAKEQFGDNKLIEYLAATGGVAAGSILGHPADTALTQLQAEVELKPRLWMKGWKQKARGVAIFAICFKLGKETLQLKT